MKKLILSFALLSLLAASTQAGVILGTSNPPGTPLTMSAGTISGPMLVNVVSDNPPNDIMSAWGFELTIMPEPGASGTLSFQDPSTTTPANPPNYIFGADGLGIAASNSGSTLTANDFFDPSVGPGATVPGTPGASLLQVDFLASSNASGLFGIYAVEGVAVTQWTDGNANTQLFTNVPDGSGTVLIGEVLIPQVVSEPLSLMMLGMGGAILAGWQWRRNWKQTTKRVSTTE